MAPPFVPEDIKDVTGTSSHILMAICRSDIVITITKISININAIA